MARSDNVTAGGGCLVYAGVPAVLVALKLTHVVDWSWWWVLSPLWVMFALMVVIAAVYATLLLVGVGAVQHWSRRWRRKA
ncbi:hypothetical protein [Dactylosporangium sp. NPDC051541]|uniref:hypothetical protein n=1 Tax=Dactylosporangium sp. NPDC051541 TaxID=3363977 RepID=UPI0037A30AAF